mmetsp:Transcript_21641/g.56458  ORF Transcript_21641/g.56458 Transcript_21641/m.56458 type:complete len:204 (-) Transcript_21641:511-1122(-)
MAQRCGAVGRQERMFIHSASGTYQHDARAQGSDGGIVVQSTPPHRPPRGRRQSAGRVQPPAIAPQPPPPLLVPSLLAAGNHGEIGQLDADRRSRREFDGDLAVSSIVGGHSPEPVELGLGHKTVHHHVVPTLGRRRLGRRGGLQRDALRFERERVGAPPGGHHHPAARVGRGWRDNHCALAVELGFRHKAVNQHGVALGGGGG